jgi:hypothetical protein
MAKTLPFQLPQLVRDSHGWKGFTIESCNCVIPRIECGATTDICKGVYKLTSNCTNRRLWLNKFTHRRHSECWWRHGKRRHRVWWRHNASSVMTQPT